MMSTHLLATNQKIFTSMPLRVLLTLLLASIPWSQKLIAMDHQQNTENLTMHELSTVLRQLEQRSIDAEISAANCRCASCSTVAATSIIAQATCAGSTGGLACLSTCGLSLAYYYYQCAQGFKQEAVNAQKGLIGYKKYLGNREIIRRQGPPLVQTMSYAPAPSARVINE